jgi:cytochrome P450
MPPRQQLGGCATVTHVVTGVEVAARRRLSGWLLRFYSERRQRSGSSLLSLLPSSSLVPLRRNLLDPVADLGKLRDKEPVSRLKLPFGVRAWLVTGYDESKAVLAAADAFSNDFRHVVTTAGIPTGHHSPGGLGFADPPDHTRLRRLLTPEFTVRRLSRLGPQIETTIADQLDEMAKIAERDGQVDLHEHFALPIPSLVICDLLGIPYEDRADFQRLSAARFDFLGGTDGSLGAISESVAYVLGVVERQRVEPGPGLLGMLIKEHGDEITDLELAGLTDGLLTGGLETTTSMLALGALVLLQNSSSLAEIRDRDEQIAPIVEELLRYLTVVQVAFPRLARRDLTVGGQTILAGDIVLCSLSGANRDARQGTDMDRFDPTRPPSQHLAFGHGIHRCIGAELARMELRAAYPALVRRFPDIKLAVPAEQLSFRKLSFVYGVDALPVTLG